MVGTQGVGNNPDVQGKCNLMVSCVYHGILFS